MAANGTITPPESQPTPRSLTRTSERACKTKKKETPTVFDQEEDGKAVVGPPAKKAKAGKKSPVCAATAVAENPGASSSTSNLAATPLKANGPTAGENKETPSSKPMIPAGHKGRRGRLLLAPEHSVAKGLNALFGNGNAKEAAA